MKPENENPFPLSAQSAFDNYPELKPTAAFNRAVLLRLEREQERRRATLLGQIEEFLGLDLWRFAASGMLGAFLPALILAALYFSNRSMSQEQREPVHAPPTIARSLGPFYAREWEIHSELFPKVQNKATPAKPLSGDEISCLDSNSPLV
ncbi:hypothetical protein EON80_04350 [bacterium]|nr:MAG: hypothetical protein EON80_04350 [bacterium]